MDYIEAYQNFFSSSCCVHVYKSGEFGFNEIFDAIKSSDTQLSPISDGGK